MTTRKEFETDNAIDDLVEDDFFDEEDVDDIYEMATLETLHRAEEGDVAAQSCIAQHFLSLISEDEDEKDDEEDDAKDDDSFASEEVLDGEDEDDEDDDDEEDYDSDDDDKFILVENDGEFLMQNKGLYAYIEENFKTQEELEAETVKWFKLAASNGDSMCQYNLGMFYYSGMYVEKDILEAAKWFYKASLQGDNEASCMLQRMSLSNEVMEKIKNQN